MAQVIVGSVKRKAWQALALAALLACSGVQAQETAPQGHKGWVRITIGGMPPQDWNNETGAMAGASIRWNNEEVIQFIDPARREQLEYLPATGVLYHGSADPQNTASQVEIARTMPLTVAGLLSSLRAALGDDAVKAVQSTDRRMDRFDITAPPVPAEVNLKLGPLGAGNRVPASVWADPQSKLIRELRVNGKTITLAYDHPIASIYDIGVPRNAKVIDNRASAEAWELHNRIQAAAERPFPDGVIVMLQQQITGGKAVNGMIAFSGRSGGKWSMRSFPVAGNDPAAQRGAVLKLPENWRSAGADELFRLLATLVPSEDWSGDGKTVSMRNIDPFTGEVGYTDAIYRQGPDGRMTGTTERRAGPRIFTGESARMMERQYSLVSSLYPSDSAVGISSSRNKLELKKSPDQPGLAALRAATENRNSRFIVEEWVDPAHNDRAVMFTTTSFNASGIVSTVHVKEFGDYATLPAPDGRSYPTTMTDAYFSADANGNLASGGQTKTIYQFFPGRQLPPVPDIKGRP